MFEKLDTKEKQEGFADPLCYKNTDRTTQPQSPKTDPKAQKRWEDMERWEEIGIDTLGSESHSDIFKGDPSQGWESLLKTRSYLLFDE